MKKMILKGKEIMIGGNIIILVDIRIEVIMRLMVINGR